MPAEQHQSSPRKLTLALLFFALLGICYRSTWFYDQLLYADPTTWLTVLHGTAAAPDQYRIGVIFPAFWLSHLTHLKLGWTFAVLDFFSGALAITALYSILERSPIFRSATPIARWLAAATFAATVLFYLQWTYWYARVETLPAAGLTALLLWLISPNPDKPPSPTRPYLTATAFLIITIALALIRADLALCIALGLLLTTFTHIRHNLSIPRNLALAASLLTAAIVAAIQLYLIKVAYPQATYGTVHIVMFLHDYYRPHMWFAFLIFLAPFLYTLHQTLKRRTQTSIPASSQAFLFAALAYLFLWITFGRLNEVRIFLPIALTLTPLLAQLILLRADDSKAPHDPDAPRL